MTFVSGTARRDVVRPQTVRVLAMCREETARRLRERLPSWCTLTAHAALPEAARAIETRCCDTLVLDPVSLRLDAMNRIVGVAADAGIGVLIYGPLDRESASRITQILRRVSCDLLFCGAEDESGLVADRLRALASASTPSLIARELAPAFMRLSADVRSAVMGLFGWLPVPASAAGLVTRARATDRHLQRLCVKCGLAAPGRLLLGARLARAWDAMKAGERVAIVARTTGWDSVEQFRSHFRRFVGLSPSLARDSVETAEFVHRLAEGLRDGASRSEGSAAH